jgi:hypothetical protein
VAKDPRFDDLTRRIKQLEKPTSATTGTASQTTEPWLKRNSYWIALLLTGGSLIVAVVVFVFGAGALRKIFTLAVNEAIDGRLEKPNQDIHQLQIDVGKIGVRLDLREKATLTPQEFKRSLPALSDTLKKAAETGVQSSPETRSAIQRSLQSTEDTTPGYWSAVSRFISYSSEQNATQQVRSLLAGNARRCFDLKPELALVDRPGGQVRLAPYETLQNFQNMRLRSPRPFLDGLVWRNCVVDLDDNRPSGINLQSAADRPSFFQFWDCVVRYGGGPITQIPTGVKLQNCIYVFSLTGAPPKAGENLSRTLLASLASSAVRIPKLE